MKRGRYLKNGTEWSLRGYASDVIRYRYLVAHLASAGMRARMQGSAGGLIWTLAHPLVMAGIFGLVFGRVFAGGDVGGFIAYVLVGVVVFELFAALSAGSLNVLNSAQPFLRQARVPKLVFVGQHILHQLVLFTYGGVGLVIVSATLGLGILSAQGFLLIVALILVAVTFAPVSIIGAIWGDKDPEIRPVIGYAVIVLYYLSPVFIPRTLFESGPLRTWSAINPITHALDAVRAPLLMGEGIPSTAVAGLLIWAVLLWSTAFLLLQAEEGLVWRRD